MTALQQKLSAAMAKIMTSTDSSIVMTGTATGTRSLSVSVKGEPAGSYVDNEDET
jgi:hypothetical protein